MISRLFKSRKIKNHGVQKNKVKNKVNKVKNKIKINY